MLPRGSELLGRAGALDETRYFILRQMTISITLFYDPSPL